MASSPSLAHRATEAAKVPATITAIFWATKLLTTAAGETISDGMVHAMAPVLAVAIGFVALVAAMVVQFRAPRYVPWTYWLAATMVSVFGTMAADVIHVALGVPYVVSTVTFALVLALVFVVWSRREGTLSIHSITTPAREAFYWLVVITTFALGTAAGDLTAIAFKLGYLTSGLLFTIVFLIPALGYWKLHWNGVFAFWFAYILTRPVGASFADWLEKPRNAGGLDLGHALVGGVLVAGIVGAVLLQQRRWRADRRA
jgi:uncharacterized membrane-anchored protein